MDLQIHFAVDKPRKLRYLKVAEKADVDLSEWIRRVCDAAADEQLDE